MQEQGLCSSWCVVLYMDICGVKGLNCSSKLVACLPPAWTAPRPPTNLECVDVPMRPWSLFRDVDAVRREAVAEWAWLKLVLREDVPCVP